MDSTISARTETATAGLSASLPAMPSGLRHYRLMAGLLDSLHLGLCLFDAEDRALLWNQTFLRLFPEHAGHVAVGEPYAENLRRFYAARQPEAEPQAIDRCIAAGLARHRSQAHPFIFQHRGQWVRVASEPVPGIGRIRIWTPIAPPDRSASLAPPTEDGMLPEVMPFAAEDGDGLVQLDTEGRILAATGGFARFFRLPAPEAAIGHRLADLYAAAMVAQPGVAEGVGAWLQRLADAERFTGAPFELPMPGGGWLRMLQQRMPDGSIVGSFVDISAMKALQEELSRAREAAEEASRAKDRFLATVSHELRTPMNGILGMLDMLGDGRLAPDQADWHRLARDSAEALLGLLDDILAFSRLQAGELAPEPAPANPAELLDGIVRLLQPRAREKELSLRWALDGTVPDTVLCDTARLRQVLLNLIANALKFTEAGSVGVTVRAGAALPDGRLLLEFEVADTGIGIPAAALDSIFEPFVQADAGIARRFGGTGLGLAICRQLVAAMGGHITVASEPGQGSRFRFTVACRPAPTRAVPVARAAEPVPPLPLLRVLVVDDHPVNREVARLHLDALGLEAATVESGAAALAACAERFDLVLLDLEMPGMDGFATAAALRASGLPSARAPIIALTAHAGAEHRALCREAGMQGFVSKPVRLAMLARAIAEATGAPCGSGGPIQTSGPGGPAVIGPHPGSGGPIQTSGPGGPAVIGPHPGSGGPIQTSGPGGPAVIGPHQATAAPQPAPAASGAARGIPAAAWERILLDFEEYARGAMTRLSTASREGRPHAAVAHALKGAAWNLGARRLGDLMHRIEALGSAELGRHLPAIHEALDAAVQDLRRGRAA
ncbi:hybrid sensor histidine kinase/response regulator [Roseicella aquatilis]|uniref:histidine kinase n=1 Tax=Roseicella aquatilis TaxID=2527868 RepID=A0A4R4DPZ1_9PROT|nr:ATP-binding protein [Roseicella aquatilis]TCZ64009.1 response regulator [Roseicella aquatilis]